ncbi:hypothetical protein [Paraclostridium bifermentans]|uniref:hypothetical protein n=1 Tax=Paraclostridium bifermentans TaxID=1490 RepID=UPI00374EC3A5
MKELNNEELRLVRGGVEICEHEDLEGLEDELIRKLTGQQAMVIEEEFYNFYDGKSKLEDKDADNLGVENIFEYSLYIPLSFVQEPTKGKLAFVYTCKSGKPEVKTLSTEVSYEFNPIQAIGMTANLKPEFMEYLRLTVNDIFIETLRNEKC